MIDALGEWMMQPVYYAGYGRREFPRSGARHPSIAPYGPYRAADGMVYLGIQSDREWQALCREILGRPELGADPRFVHNPERVEHNDEIQPLVEAAFAGRAVREVMAALEECGIACAEMRRPEELLIHPQLAARDRWREVGSPGGPIQALLPPVVVPGREAAMGAVPRLGEHTDALRAEFG